MISDLPCTWCGNRTARADLVAPRAHYSVCKGCGSAFVLELIDFDRYYREYFPDGVQQESPAVARRYGVLLDELARVAPGKRMLEIGCGNGHLLALARAAGWQVSGIELSASEAEHCRARGLDVRTGDLLRDRLFPGQTFDVVILIEVLEHLPNPIATLRAIAERLAAHGVLYLTTPNFASLSRRLLNGRWSVLDPEHVGLATPLGLRRALVRSGFSDIRMRSRNLNVAELRQHFTTRTTQESAAPFSRAAAAADLRDRIDASRMLTLAKRAANVALNTMGLGDTLEVWATP